MLRLPRNLHPEPTKAPTSLCSHAKMRRSFAVVISLSCGVRGAKTSGCDHELHIHGSLDWTFVIVRYCTSNSISFLLFPFLKVKWTSTFGETLDSPGLLWPTHSYLVYSMHSDKYFSAMLGACIMCSCYKEVNHEGYNPCNIQTLQPLHSRSSSHPSNKGSSASLLSDAVCSRLLRRKDAVESWNNDRSAFAVFPRWIR